MKTIHILFITVGLIFLFVSVMMADTIFLKNGRKIVTSWVKIEGDKVKYKWPGGIMSINKDLVLKIVKDNFAEPEKREDLGLNEDTEDTSNTKKAADLKRNDEMEEIAEEEQPDEKSTSEYWGKELNRLQTEKADLDRQLKDLQNLKVGLMRARRSTTEVNKRIAEIETKINDINKEMVDMQEEARQSGVNKRQLEIANEKAKEDKDKEKEGNKEEAR